MPRQPLFAGLVLDEFGNPADTTVIGDEPCYVVVDSGFRRHIPSEQVDRQVLEAMRNMIQGNEDLLAEQAAKMIGQEDPFSKAMLETQLKQIDQQFDLVMQSGIPENGRAFMGMMGFQIKINIHGDVIDINQPGMIDPDQE